MERLLADLRTGRQQLTRSIEEATSAVDDHRLAWQQLAARHPDSRLGSPAAGPRAQIEQGRRREAYYLGQAVALTWALQLLDATLRQQGSHAAGRVFSCPLPPATDSLVEEHPRRSETQPHERQHDLAMEKPSAQHEARSLAQ